MRPSSGRDDESSHLAPCSECGAANGVNALQCWNCESALPVRSCEAVAIPGGVPAAAPPAAEGRLPSASRAEPSARFPEATDGAARAEPDRDEGAPERLHAALGDASSRASRRRRTVATGAAMVVIAAGAIGYAAYQNPVRIALSPFDLSRAALAGGPQVVEPVVGGLRAGQTPEVRADAVPAARPVPVTRTTPRPALHRPSAPAARGQQGARGNKAAATAPVAHPARKTTRQTAQRRPDKPAKTASTAHAERGLDVTETGLRR